MHNVSTVQCELVCFSGGHFVDPVLSRKCGNGIYRGHQLDEWDLELLPLASHLSGV